MAEALGLVLITEVDRHTASVGDGIGIGVLAALAQQVLERTVGLEVVQQLGLAGRGNDDGVVDLLGVECLLDDILDDRLVEHRQHLFGRALGARQKTRAKTGGGDDCLHVIQRSFRRRKSAPCVRRTAADQIAIPKHLTAGTICRYKAETILQQVNANYCSNGAILLPNGRAPDATQITEHGSLSNRCRGTEKQKRRGSQCEPRLQRNLARKPDYLRVTAAPAASSFSLAASASSFLAPSRTALGAPSTTSLASFRPRLVSSRTALMT